MKKRYWYTFSYTTSEGSAGNGEFASCYAKPTRVVIKSIKKFMEEDHGLTGVTVVGIQRLS